LELILALQVLSPGPNAHELTGKAVIENKGSDAEGRMPEQMSSIPVS